MNLVKELRKNGYDQIESPIRNHKPLQLWLKKPQNSIEYYAEHISMAFSSDEILSITEDNALSVNYNAKQKYDFNLGINILEGVLGALKLGSLGLAAKFGHGKNVTMSYNAAKTFSVPMLDLSNFLSTATFKFADNDEFMKNANKDNIIVITGVLAAEDFIATIETDSDIQASVELELTELADGKVDFTRVSNKKLQMKSEGKARFPIAVKANKIDWDNDKYKKMVLVTDNRFLF